MKKILIKLGLLSVLVFTMPSCNKFLDVVPDNIAVIEEAFDTRDSAYSFLATLYGYIPNHSNLFSNPALTGGDEINVNLRVSDNWPGRLLGIGGQNTNNPLFSRWGNNGSVSNLFIALRDCNIFLENLDRPFDLQEFERVRWEAEAKFLKAYFHFYLMRMYGPIPIMRENVDVGASVEAVRVKRDPVDDVADYIVELLDEAIEELPVSIQITSEFGRVSKAVAAAIKAKTLITVASPLFNGNTDYSNLKGPDGEQLISQTVDPAKWEKAAAACLQAIELAHEAGHALYEFDEAADDWSDSTITKLSIRGSVTEPWNKELIWGSSQFRISFLQNQIQPRIVPGLNSVSAESVVQYYAADFDMAEMFYSENGVPIDEDPSYDYENRYQVAQADAAHKYYIPEGWETAKLNMNREPRFHASLNFDGGIMAGNGVASDKEFYALSAKRGDWGGVKVGERYSQTGYWPKKLIYYTNTQNAGGGGYSRTDYPFPVVRLADLYLLYAEALNESVGPADAYEWIDKVRTRAGLNGVVASWSAHSKTPEKPTTREGLRSIIQQERMIELVFEGHRFWDLRRWKRAVQVMNRDKRGWNIFGTNTTDYYNVVVDGAYKFTFKDYLWPIAQFDVVRNSNLVQNPGWQ